MLYDEVEQHLYECMYKNVSFLLASSISVFLLFSFFFKKGEHKFEPVVIHPHKSYYNSLTLRENVYPQSYKVKTNELKHKNHAHVRMLHIIYGTKFRSNHRLYHQVMIQFGAFEMSLDLPQRTCIVVLLYVLHSHSSMFPSNKIR